MFKKIVKEKIKKFLFKFTQIGAPNYSYNLEPIQLAEIINSLEKVKSLDGSICEIGVARGMTTRFICEYLSSINFRSEYYCIDTFNSFDKKDIQFEVEKRNCRYTFFKENKKSLNTPPVFLIFLLSYTCSCSSQFVF